MGGQWRNPRISLWWSTTAGCIISLLAGAGSMTKFAVVGLVICGSVAASTAAFEHGWHRAPLRIGTPIRATILLFLIWAPMCILGHYVWPKGRPQPRFSGGVSCSVCEFGAAPGWSLVHLWFSQPLGHGTTIVTCSLISRCRNTELL